MRALPFATRPRRWVLLAVIPILLVGAVAGFFWFRPPPDAHPVGDVNNDGLPDVVVTQYGGVKLFLNLGGGRFENVTEEAGLSNPLWSSSAAFVDYDRDGRLDLVVVNYLDYDPQRDCLSPQGTK